MKHCSHKVAVLALTVLVHTAVADMVLESPAAQVGLLELYTSEGCSSCPPADRWISKLKDNERLWQEFIPLAFHVDYWDYIGWKDRFASRAYSQRQRRYEAEGSLRTVYTPGFVYNGQEWRNWFGLRSTKFPRGGEAGVLRAVLGGDEIRIAFAPSADERQELRVTVALLGVGLQTQVRAGENRGRTLLHDFVVLGMSEKKLQQAESLYTTVLTLPESNIDAQRYALAVWVSGLERQAPLQATGGWLPATTATH